MDGTMCGNRPLQAWRSAASRGTTTSPGLNNMFGQSTDGKARPAVLG
jgi:hypothetical protein